MKFFKITTALGVTDSSACIVAMEFWFLHNRLIEEASCLITYPFEWRPKRSVEPDFGLGNESAEEDMLAEYDREDDDSGAEESAEEETLTGHES